MPSPAARILVVDDERLLHGVIARALGRQGMEVTSCTSAPQALDVIGTAEAPFDLVVTDFQMPEMDGLELLARVRERHPRLPVVMITGHASVQHAVRALNGGAVDYLPKPFTIDTLIDCVQRHLGAEVPPREGPGGPPAAPAEAPAEARPASNGRRARAEARDAARETEPAPHPVDFVGEHPGVVQLKLLLPRFARSRAPVFIHGESGTGKEVLARLIHDESDRAGGPFVALNCANLPSELVESHLFGHKKGAFTGAVEDMTGAFGRADGGTILLDEVTEVALPVQAKLLRVLQEQEFQPVGSERTVRVDVRVVATSNRDLQQAVRSGHFREDLYHRLAVFPLHVPPLRERRSDIPLLAGHFAAKYCALYGLQPKTLAPDLMAALQAHPWTGNVRELGNLLHRGVVLAADRAEVTRADVMHPFFAGSPPPRADARLPEGGPQTLDEMERLMILRALREHGGNRERAAEQLGVSARTIRNKLKRYREEGLLEGQIEGALSDDGADDDGGL